MLNGRCWVVSRSVVNSGRKVSANVYLGDRGFDEQILLNAAGSNVTLLISFAPIIQLGAAELNGKLTALVPLGAVRIKICGQAELLRK